MLSLRVVLLSGMWTWGYDSHVGAYCYRRVAKGNGWRTADVAVPYDVRGVTVRMHYHQYQCVDPHTTTPTHHPPHTTTPTHHPNGVHLAYPRTNLQLRVHMPSAPDAFSMMTSCPCTPSFRHLPPAGLHQTYVDGEQSHPHPLTLAADIGNEHCACAGMSFTLVRGEEDTDHEHVLVPLVIA